MSISDQISSVSLQDFHALLERANRERWSQLTLIGTLYPVRHAKELPDEIRQSQNIYRLSDCIEGLASKLLSLTSLSSLNLWGNDIGAEDVTVLAGLTNLTSLYLWNTNIGDEGARALATLTNLNSLYLWNTSIGDKGARALATLANLSSLDLWKNNITDEGARAIAALTNLTSLNLANNEIGEKGARALATLTNLASLNLAGNRIREGGVQAVAALTNLTSLNFAYNEIGDKGASALPTLTKLASLNLAGNRIGEEGVRAVAALTNLTTLNLWGNSIGDDGARAIATLPSLVSLNLTGNHISDEGAQALARLTNLTSLNLTFNKIGNKGVGALAALINLRSLNLKGNAIDQRGVRALAALTNLNSLNLTGNRIGDGGTHAVAAIISLTSLELALNGIGEEGARAIAALTNLTSLNLAWNDIGILGARAIATLTSLTSLNLAGCAIGDKGAQAVATLTNLTSLNLAGNDIGIEGARKIATLTNLTSLNLAGNDFGDEGARAVAALADLDSLSLAGCTIGDEGARAVVILTNLTSLDLWNNNVGDKGARAVAALANLTSLNLATNRIGEEGARVLLEDWSDSPVASTRSFLALQDNSGFSSVLPAEVLDTTDAQSILSAYRRFRSAAAGNTLRPLNEAKLLVIGNEAVGKTSLVKFLIRNEPRDPNEAKTRGVAIHDQIVTQWWAPATCDIKLNVWDFGGQEVVRGTHRYFLTERSLYLMVLEDRREDDRSIHDWLKTILNRGGSSPIIVVINKSDQGKQDLRLDEVRLQQDYPNIVGFLRTSCEPDKWAADSIEALRQRIVATLSDHEQLRHVRDPIPANWLQIKNRIAAMARDQRVLPLADFQQLCGRPAQGEEHSAEAISDPNEQRALLRLLHDLGVVIAHGLGRGAPAVKREITLLDPNWLTAAIYELVNQPMIRNQGGEFDRSQLNDWLDPRIYPVDRHEFILTMMQDPDLGLCLELPGNKAERYLIPEALPASAPYYENWPDHSLRFRYRYDFLPRELIPRLIVQAYMNLAEPPTCWRTGAVLKAANCPILVRGDLGQRRIDIAVDGPQPLRRSALNIVLNHLEAVHEANLEIGPDPRVPLPDLPELEVGYVHLLALEERYGPDHALDPEGAERAYTVRELLDGVRRDRSRLEERYEGPPGPHIVTGERAQITVVHGGIRTGSGSTEIGSRRGTTGLTQDSPSSDFASRPIFSIGCGVGAILFAIILWWLPSDEWRATVGGLAGLGLLVALLVLWRHPSNFYRRHLSYVIPGGLLVNALGSTIEIFASNGSEIGWLRWDGTASVGFFLAWAAIVGFLVWGDSKQRR